MISDMERLEAAAWIKKLHTSPTSDEWQTICNKQELLFARCTHSVRMRPIKHYNGALEIPRNMERMKGFDSKSKVDPILGKRAVLVLLGEDIVPMHCTDEQMCNLELYAQCIDDAAKALQVHFNYEDAWMYWTTVREYFMKCKLNK